MDRIQLRRDTSARWKELNPVLLEGEVGFETDTKLRKIGDGTNAWNSLDYLAAENIVQELGNSETTVISQKGVTNVNATTLAKVNSTLGIPRVFHNQAYNYITGSHEYRKDFDCVLLEVIGDKLFYKSNNTNIPKDRAPVYSGSGNNLTYLGNATVDITTKSYDLSGFPSATFVALDFEKPMGDTVDYSTFRAYFDNTALERENNTLGLQRNYGVFLRGDIKTVSNVDYTTNVKVSGTIYYSLGNGDTYDYTDIPEEFESFTLSKVSMWVFNYKTKKFSIKPVIPNNNPAISDEINLLFNVDGTLRSGFILKDVVDSRLSNLNTLNLTENIVYSMQQGSLASATGLEINNPNRIRTDFINVDSFILTLNKNFGFNVFYYNDSGDLISSESPVFMYLTKFRSTFKGLIRVVVVNLDENTPILPNADTGLNIESVDFTIEELRGKKLSVLGDSISTYAGEIPVGNETQYSSANFPVATMWWKRLIDKTGMVKEVIDAWSGSRVSTGYSDSRVSMCDNLRLSRLGNPDYIILFGGINDWRYNCQLGEYYSGSGNYDLTKFRQAFEYTIRELLMRYPKAKLLACTMLQDGRITDSPTFPQYKSSVGYLYEYVDSIRLICSRYGVTCIDLFEKSGITYWNGQADISNIPTANNTKTLDGLHPNREGQKDIFNQVVKYIL